MSYGNQDVQASGTAARPANFTDRASSVAERLSNLNGRLSNVLNKIRGAHPTAIDKDQAKAVNSPTLESINRRTENLLSQAEDLVGELDNAF